MNIGFTNVKSNYSEPEVAMKNVDDGEKSYDKSSAPSSTRVSLYVNSQVRRLREELGNNPYATIELNDIDLAKLPPREELDALLELQERSDDEWHKEWNH